MIPNPHYVHFFPRTPEEVWYCLNLAFADIAPYLPVIIYLVVLFFAGIMAQVMFSRIKSSLVWLFSGILVTASGIVMGLSFYPGWCFPLIGLGLFVFFCGSTICLLSSRNCASC